MTTYSTIRWFAWRLLVCLTIALVAGVLAIAYNDALEGRFLDYLQPNHTVSQQHDPGARSSSVFTLR